MSIKIQQLGLLSPALTGLVFDFLSPKEIARTINHVQASWRSYMPSGVLNLRSLSITDRDLTVILSKSSCSYPNTPLTLLAIDYCTQLTFRSGQLISEIQTLTHLSLAETTNEEESDVASGLKCMPGLVHLDLSGTLGWKPKVIAQYSSLKELILTDWCCDETFKPLSGLSLERLDVSNNLTMTQNSAACINKMTSLKVLDISETFIPPHLVERPGLIVINASSPD